MAEHEYASWGDGHEFGNALVVLFENDKHGEKLFTARDGGNSFAEAGEKERMKNFEALAELGFTIRLKYGRGEGFKFLTLVFIIKEVLDFLRSDFLISVRMLELLYQRR